DAHSRFLREVCGDEGSLEAIARDPDGASLGALDRAVFRFAAKVATDAPSVEQSDVDELREVGLTDRAVAPSVEDSDVAHQREVGLTDRDVADIVFAAAARSFFARVLDGLGAQLDV